MKATSPYPLLLAFPRCPFSLSHKLPPVTKSIMRFLAQRATNACVPCKGHGGQAYAGLPPNLFWAALKTAHVALLWIHPPPSGKLLSAVRDVSASAIVTWGGGRLDVTHLCAKRGSTKDIVQAAESFARRLGMSKVRVLAAPSLETAVRQAGFKGKRQPSGGSWLSKDVGAAPGTNPNLF